MKTNDVTLNDAGDMTLELETALLLYSNNIGSAVYATAHDLVMLDDGTPALGPGKPAGKDSLVKFAAAVGKATAYNGMVPPNLLFTAPNVIAWWTPAAKRRIWFKSDDERIGTRNASVTHPPLLFVATSDSWYVFGLASNERPTETTKLFKAPYFNVWNSGKICEGNVDLPDQLGAESIRAYEDAFFRSHFTHPNDQKLVRYEGGAAALWADQLQRPDDILLTPAVLISRKQTFKQVINSILKGSNK